MNEVLHQERKFLITLEDFVRYRNYLEKFMLQDSHNGTSGYMIRSLYFDNLYDGDYYDKEDGLEVRRKIRLRLYDPKAENAMFEMKQKTGAQQKKRSLKMTRQDAIRVSRGDYSPLLAYSDPFAAECYGVMNYQCYRPKTIVQYNRKAFIAKENQIRITFDNQITATECCYDIFAENLNQYPVLDPFQVVLEVKYNHFLLNYIQDLINSISRSEISVSKYCMARGTTQMIR